MESTNQTFVDLYTKLAIHADAAGYMVRMADNYGKEHAHAMRNIIASGMAKESSIILKQIQHLQALGQLDADLDNA